MHRLRTALVAFAALAAAPSAFAVTYTWPGAAPCHTTLAACVDAVAAGSVIEIATQGPIDEDVQILLKSLTVRPAPGFEPAFAPTRSLRAESRGAPVFNVHFEGLTLTDSSLDLVSTGTGDASFVVRRMRLLTSDPSIASRIAMLATNSGSFTFDIAENRVDSRSDSSTRTIGISVSGPTASGSVRFNRVTSVGDSVSSGIAAGASAGTLELDVFGNEVRGNFGFGAIVVSDSAGSGAPAQITVRIVNNVVVGRGASVGSNLNGVRVSIGADGDIAVHVANNTVVATRGGLALGLGVPGATGTVTGTVRNNLVAFNDDGLAIFGHAATVTNSHNLVFGNGSNLYVPGPGTVTNDPQLLSTFYPRLGAGSPAINAGDAPYTQLLLFLYGLPQVDADGMRRTIGSGGVDIGAYEFGDTSFVASKTSAGSNNFAFDHPATNGQPNVRPLLTKNFSIADVSDPFAIGVYYSGGLWRAFNQRTIDVMPAGTAMNVFVPGLGGSLGASYAHVATAANTSGHVTTLDDSYLNSTCDAIVLVTNNWSASGSGVYNNHHVSVGCLGSWLILNQDFVAMPLNAGFNVYAQDPSPNAYQHVVAPHNVTTLVNSTMLDHPLLNGIDCAQVQVTQFAGGALNDHPYDVYYQSGRWHIYNQDLAPLPMGAAFHVLVNPRQVFECTDLIFEDGFE